MTPVKEMALVDIENETAYAEPYTPDAPAVYDCIAKVSTELAKQGIGKDSTNAQQNYKFRGIDAVYNGLAPLLGKHGLVILPRIIERTVTERITPKGSTLFYVVVTAEFDFVAASDGSKHTIRTYGEAMDSGDKATNKAMSAAYKYAAFQAFCIPTEGDNDADATTHEVVPDAPDGFDEWLNDLHAVAKEGVEALRAAWRKSPEHYRTFCAKSEIEALKAKSRKADEDAEERS